jgi:hypothetical protein
LGNSCTCRGGSSFPPSCLTQPIEIPDNSPDGVYIDLILPEVWPEACPGSFNGNVSVVLGINHAWLGDLIVRITHNNTQVTLIDRPGLPAQPFGCGVELSCTRQIALVDGSEPIECSPAPCVTCFPNFQVPAAGFGPNEPLSGAFHGHSLGGLWRLFISDNAAFDVGSICCVMLVASCDKTTAVKPSSWGGIKAAYRE